ncbi:5604_t:CDS:1 [Cetraspora pellucida]|uniref:5604_t:CDS:1 n=1 Tax=Cetraspora pellucida TaxID=1433469 RepID=A0A9N9ES37_9GLOM|nr:5604_t:CDS:1 [Cetraspora pellucida]
MAYPYTFNNKNNDYNAVEYNNNGYTNFGNNGNNFQEQQLQRVQDIYENNRYPPIDNRPLNNGRNLGYSQQPEPLQDYNRTSPKYSSPPLEVYPPSPNKQPQEEIQHAVAEPLVTKFGQQEMQPQYKQYNIQQQYIPDYSNYQNQNYNSQMQSPLYNPQMPTPMSYGHEPPSEPSYNYHNQISKPDYLSSSTYNLNQTQPYSRSPFNTENTAYTSNGPQPPKNNYSNYSQSQNTTYTSNDPYPPNNYSPPLNAAYTSNDPRPPKSYTQNIENTSSDPRLPKSYTQNIENTTSDPRPPKNYSPTLNKAYTSNDPRPPKNYSPSQDNNSPRPPKSYSPSQDNDSPRPPKNYSPPTNTSSTLNAPRAPKNYSPSQNANSGSQNDYSPSSQPAIEVPTYMGGNKKDRILQKNDRCCSCSICGCIQCTCTVLMVLIGVIFIIAGVAMFIYARTLPSFCGSSCDPSQVTNSTNSTSAIPGNATTTVNKAVGDGSSQCKAICQKIIYEALYYGGWSCIGFGALLVLVQILKTLCKTGQKSCFCC